MIEIVPVTMEHVHAIDLRPGDAAECAALGMTKVEAMHRAIGRSLWSETYMVDGEPGAIRGLILPSLTGRIASPWLMTGVPVERYRKSFMELTRDGIERLRPEWDMLVSYVHADYARSIAWLRWLGFDIGPAAPVGRLGALFCPVTMRNDR